MHRMRTAGGVLTALALAAYVAGMWASYPGRALSIAAFMLGATLVAVGGVHD